MKEFRNLFGNQCFNVFYDETIIVKTKGNISQSLNVCIFQDVESEPISENIDSTMESISILARKEDWGFVSRLQRGDTITRPCLDKNYRISSIQNDEAMGILVKARMV